MEIRFKNLEDASIKMFHYGYKRYEVLAEREQHMAARIFNDIINGSIDCLYYVSDKFFRAYHRSPKNEGAVQFSCGYYSSGELIPTNDVQMYSVQEMLREGIIPGIWKTYSNTTE